MVAILPFIPWILSKIIDPRNKRIIRDECIKLGLDRIDIELWPNHYGVRGEKDGHKVYFKCRVKSRKIKWIVKNPAEDRNAN
jgi:hypothetical protein